MRVYESLEVAQSFGRDAQQWKPDSSSWSMRKVETTEMTLDPIKTRRDPSLSWLPLQSHHNMNEVLWPGVLLGTAI